MNRTYKAVRENYSWHNMKREIVEYVKQCKSCQINKVLGHRGKGPMEITTTLRQPFERCCLDIVEPLTETQEGNKYLLTFQDELSKFLVAIPIPKQDAETVARKFIKHIILRVGTPRKLLTDQGSNFLREVFRNTCKVLKIKKLQTTPFHPESNGDLETSHGVLKEYLRANGMSGYHMRYMCITHRPTHTQATRSLNWYMGSGPQCLRHYKKTQAYNYDFVTELKNRYGQHIW
jgi:transposase InsO family protein